MTWCRAAKARTQVLLISLQLFLVWQTGQRWTWAMVKQSRWKPWLSMMMWRVNLPWLLLRKAPWLSDRYCFSFPVQCCTFSVLINPLAHSPMLFLHYICCSCYQDTAVVNFRWVRCLMHAKRRVSPSPLATVLHAFQWHPWQHHAEYLKVCGREG